MERTGEGVVAQGHSQLSTLAPFTERQPENVAVDLLIWAKHTTVKNKRAYR